MQTNNRDAFLSLEFGLEDFGVLSVEVRFSHYRAYVYEKGGIFSDSMSPSVSGGLLVQEKDRFRYRTRYFIDSGIIGSKEFVQRIYFQFKDLFPSIHEKKPRSVTGLPGLYSFKRLSEKI